ncbi:MAG TPA: zincin-like metallopeptidase domain-containing protein [Victivallales bacterium]|nr:zincin-like metallopeptidase domain-containing protein [Victivallales bacterium]
MSRCGFIRFESKILIQTVNFDTNAPATPSPANDSVYMQPIEMFKSEKHYYSTIFHELTHSTGHASRLKRLENDSLKFGSKTYAKEELLADLGAAFLMSEANLVVDIKNRAAYIQNWLTVLKNDKRLILTAAGKAEKAVNYILNRKLETKKDRSKEHKAA